MSQLGYLANHWAVVLEGDYWYHILEFGQNGIAYDYWPTLDACARNMMGDGNTVSVSNLIGVQQDLTFGVLKDRMDEEMFSYYSVVFQNCQDFARYVIYKLRHKFWSLLFGLPFLQPYNKAFKLDVNLEYFLTDTKIINV
jgi:hypothetical protein